MIVFKSLWYQSNKYPDGFWNVYYAVDTVSLRYSCIEYPIICDNSDKPTKDALIKDLLKDLKYKSKQVDFDFNKLPDCKFKHVKTF